MPIYAYACDHCGKEVDKLQKISDPVLTECPACGKQSLQRQLTAPNFRLSGSGWYETDFKGNKDKQRNLVQETDSTKDKPKDEQQNAGKDSADKTPASQDSTTGKNAADTVKTTGEASG